VVVLSFFVIHYSSELQYRDYSFNSQNQKQNFISLLLFLVIPLFLGMTKKTTEVRSPLKGLGVGLSLSRWHMRHFGGDLTLERRPENAIRVRGDDSCRPSKWHVLGKGMTATIRIPKNADIPLAIS